MAAIFYRAKNGNVSILSNTMSILNAGFVPAKSYYDKCGDTLTYFTHADGTILSCITRRGRQSIKTVYNSKEEANAHFKQMNDGRTFQSGKWVPERKK